MQPLVYVCGSASWNYDNMYVQTILNIGKVSFRNNICACYFVIIIMIIIIIIIIMPTHPSMTNSTVQYTLA